MKRKIYTELERWKEYGAGKSFIAEEFAKNKYKSYILIDFNRVSEDITNLFIQAT